jgi:multidrug resistance efflux pump
LSRQQRETHGDIKRLREKADLLAVQIANKRNELSALKKMSTIGRDVACGAETIRAAFHGRIYRVIHRPSEYVKKGDPLFVVIPQNADVFIEAFFDRKYLGHLHKGKRLTVQFPDRTTSQGVIVDYLSAASYFAERFNKDYLPVETQLRVNLKPFDANEKIRWERYDRMDVKVTGER